MATYIKTLKDNTGNTIVPRTMTSAITTPAGEPLTGLIMGSVDGVLTEALTRDADLLENHPASYFATAENPTFTGIATAPSNTSYTTRQVRNIIYSTEDAVLANMQDGDMWIKYV